MLELFLRLVYLFVFGFAAGAQNIFEFNPESQAHFKEACAIKESAAVRDLEQQIRKARRHPTSLKFEDLPECQIRAEDIYFKALKRADQKESLNG